VIPTVKMEPCRFFRTKGMYVDDGSADGGPEPIEERPPVNCWCNRTLCETGPDDELVCSAACLEAGRRCYERR